MKNCEWHEGCTHRAETIQHENTFGEPHALSLCIMHAQAYRFGLMIFLNTMDRLRKKTQP